MSDEPTLTEMTKVWWEIWALIDRLKLFQKRLNDEMLRRIRGERR
jgi:hypothetical protein